MDWEPLLSIDPEAVTGRLVAFITAKLRQAGMNRLVIGLSGGVDSAASCVLGARAVGPENITALLLPYRTSSGSSVEHASLLAGELGLEIRTIDISPMVDTYFERFSSSGRIRRGNFMARQRMAVLFDYSAQLDALVLGTGNKTEAMLGYTTLYGDSACGLNPLGDLLKTQVRALARHLSVPDRIIEKPPSADLWEGQTDEGELGLTYETADRILHLLSHERLDQDAVTAPPYSLPAEAVETVARLIRQNRFKRRLPPVARLTEGPYEPDL